MMSSPTPKTPAPHERWRGSRAAAAVGILVLVIALSASAALHDSLLRLFGTAGELLAAYPVAGPMVFVGLAAAAAMLAFFSSATIVPIGVVTWGAEVTALLLALGWLLGGAVSYALARFFGRPLLAHLTSLEALAPYERRLGRGAPFGFIVLFQLALPSEIPGYVLGLTRYPLHKYLAALAIVEIPYAAATVWLGAEFVARRMVPLAVAAAIGAGIFVVAVMALRRRMQADIDQPASPGGTRPAHGRAASS